MSDLSSCCNEFLIWRRLLTCKGKCAKNGILIECAVQRLFACSCLFSLIEVSLTFSFKAFQLCKLRGWRGFLHVWTSVFIGLWKDDWLVFITISISNDDDQEYCLFAWMTLVTLFNETTFSNSFVLVNRGYTIESWNLPNCSPVHVHSNRLSHRQHLFRALHQHW